MARERPAEVSPILSASQLAQALAVDRGTIVDSWIPRHMPVWQAADRTKGIPWGFRLADVVRWLQDGGAIGEGPSRRDSDARRAAAEADLAELELAERRGELVPVAAVAAEVADAYASVRSRILGAATEIAREVPRVSDAGERERKTKEILSAALEVLVHEAAASAAAPDDEEDDPA